MVINWCTSQDALPGYVFCLQFVAWTVCAYFKYSMTSTSLEMLSQTSLLFLFPPNVFFAKIICTTFLEKEMKVVQVDLLFCLFTRLKHFFRTKVQHECRFKICYPHPAVDVFLRHLSNNSLFWQFNNFLKNIFPQMFSRAFSVFHRDMEHAWQPVRSGFVLHPSYNITYNVIYNKKCLGINNSVSVIDI